MMAAASASSVSHLIGWLLLSAFSISLVRSEGWSYSGATGPDHWSESYPNCGGQNQSPINIDSLSATYASGLGLTFTNYDLPISGQFAVTNNGHSVQVTIPSGSGITIDHGLLPNIYTLAQFHFHWGSDDAWGSEHSLDTKFSPLEIHLVHYNSDKYPDVATAANQTDGLAVIGILTHIDDLATFQVIDDLSSHFPDIPYEDDATTMPSFSIQSLLPASSGDYFRYRGSLTTPSCYESVVWSVFRSTVGITSAQVKRFRALHSNLPGLPDVVLVDNFRPTQHLNGRTVFRSV